MLLIAGKRQIGVAATSSQQTPQAFCGDIVKRTLLAPGQGNTLSTNSFVCFASILKEKTVNSVLSQAGQPVCIAAPGSNQLLLVLRPKTSCSQSS